MKRIGVILCSKSKKDYACSVREMYDDSSSFRARRIYMDLTYDEWYVNTTSKGFMNPSMVIEPYSGGYIKETRVVWDENILTDDVIDEWLEKLKQQFPNRDEIQLDCHLSLPYYNKLKKVFILRKINMAKKVYPKIVFNMPVSINLKKNLFFSSEKFL